jgi:hypothetical protein
MFVARGRRLLRLLRRGGQVRCCGDGCCCEKDADDSSGHLGNLGDHYTRLRETSCARYFVGK